MALAMTKSRTRSVRTARGAFPASSDVKSYSQTIGNATHSTNRCIANSPDSSLWVVALATTIKSRTRSVRTFRCAFPASSEAAHPTQTTAPVTEFNPARLILARYFAKNLIKSRQRDE